jgi:alanyl-tRNA synthetase
LKSRNFTRSRCKNCGTFFWSLGQRNVCGNAECSGGFTFIGQSPAKKKYDYVKMWQAFSRMLSKSGYKPIKRYPVTARWRDDIAFVEASIDDFIPYVISGQSDPPANPLIVPQPCLRFNDIDNVGITGGAHYTSFIMVGQHRFEKPQNYDFNKYLGHLYEWFTKGLVLDPEEIIFHEDAWAGSGNFGPCIEIFSRGLELANQVYMQFRQTNEGYADLDIKVLDMGLGYERNVWFSQGKSTSYETTFPPVMAYLRKITGLKEDSDFMKRFLPYSSFLNIDESENIGTTWKNVALQMKMDVAKLKENILPSAAQYSIAEHSRAVLIAISDGTLPSNVGGGYNLRVILRRALSFMQEYGWNIDFSKLCEIHAKYLKPLFPELLKNIKEVVEIAKIEEEKFVSTKEKSRKIVNSIVKSNIDVTEDNLLSLYESHGIGPEMIIEEAKNHGKTLKIPENFYAKLAQLHVKQRHRPEKKMEIGLEGLPKTETLFYEGPNNKEFSAKVLKILNNKYVVLDRTCFYGRAGGQEPDIGYLGGSYVYDVEKTNGIIVHFVENPKFKEGDMIQGKIDWDRRIQLAQHHTAVHIINGAARKVLGNHIWQAGANKSEKKAHIDITHYKSLTNDEIEKIEKTANNAVKRGIHVNKKVMARDKAEKEYGMRIYQGGAIPEKTIRICEIKGFDIEACSGTHLDNTKDTGQIIITSTEKIQDGVIRIILVAGKAAEDYLDERKRMISEISRILETNENEILKAAEELFEKWKKTRKKKEKVFVASGIVGELEKKIVKNVLVEKIEDADIKQLQKISKAISNDKRVLVLFGISDKIYVFGSSGKNTAVNIGEIVKQICEELGGRGGGTENLGQGIGVHANGLDSVIKKLWKELVKYEGD